jgi:glycosyltransferase involved in cell wall biosynthesis
MIVMFQRALAPYRVPLFNQLNDVLGGAFTLLLSRPDPMPYRQWTIPWSKVGFKVVVLPGHHLDVGRVTVQVSRGVRATMDELRPEAIVLGGWDVHACWTAMGWARKHAVPLVGWVESSQRTGKHRGAVSNVIRRRFLRACSAAIVPGAAAEAFIHEMAPALPCHHAPNAVDEPELRALSQPSAQDAALFMGALTERKGADLVLAAAPEILRIFPRLIIAGDGPLRREAVALAARLPGLEYAGFVEGAEKTRLFAQAGVVLIPSRRDPWPLVACEALVAGRPIVAGPGVGSLPDLQRAAGNAVSAMPAATPQDLINAARHAQCQLVPPGLRDAFRPESVAAAVAAATRSAASQ